MGLCLMAQTKLLQQLARSGRGRHLIVLHLLLQGGQSTAHGGMRAKSLP